MGSVSLAVRIGCYLSLIFPWTRQGYNDVNRHYGGYYLRYLKSLKKQISVQPAAEEAQAAVPIPESLPTTTQIPQQATAQDEGRPPSISGFALPLSPAPPPAATSASTADMDDVCLRVDAAKAEAL